ncbi:hypothetical protein CS542_00110 [Pedobacter sp. IW39]|nr:hypothetical protein CS542_00110 [Pedobacter sp. IW39]
MKQFIEIKLLPEFINLEIKSTIHFCYIKARLPFLNLKIEKPCTENECNCCFYEKAGNGLFIPDRF